MSKKIIGVISDTHGLLRPDIETVFNKVELIIHAGDIGSEDVLEKLKKIAPVMAVRGNCDEGKWVEDLPLTKTFEFGDVNFHIIHDLKKIDIDLKNLGINIVISGHSHEHILKNQDDIVYVNPGGAGPKRFKLPTTCAVLTIERNTVNVDFIYL